MESKDWSGRTSITASACSKNGRSLRWKALEKCTIFFLKKKHVKKKVRTCSIQSLASCTDVQLCKAALTSGGRYPLPSIISVNVSCWLGESLGRGRGREEFGESVREEGDVDVVTFIHVGDGTDGVTGEEEGADGVQSCTDGAVGTEGSVGA